MRARCCMECMHARCCTWHACQPGPQPPLNARTQTTASHAGALAPSASSARCVRQPQPQTAAAPAARVSPVETEPEGSDVRAQSLERPAVSPGGCKGGGGRAQPGKGQGVTAGGAAGLDSLRGVKPSPRRTQPESRPTPRGRGPPAPHRCSLARRPSCCMWGRAAAAPGPGLAGRGPPPPPCGTWESQSHSRRGRPWEWGQEGGEGAERGRVGTQPAAASGRRRVAPAGGGVERALQAGVWRRGAGAGGSWAGGPPVQCAVRRVVAHVVPTCDLSGGVEAARYTSQLVTHVRARVHMRTCKHANTHPPKHTHALNQTRGKTTDETRRARRPNEAPN
jgi:hypothetical protein